MIRILFILLMIPTLVFADVKPEVVESLVSIACTTEKGEVTGSGFFVLDTNMIATSKRLDVGCAEFEVAFQDNGKVVTYNATPVQIKETELDVMFLIVLGKGFFHKGVVLAPDSFPIQIGDDVYSIGIMRIGNGSGEVLSLLASFGRITSPLYGDYLMHLVGMPVRQGQNGSPLIDESTGVAIGVLSGYMFTAASDNKDLGHPSGHAMVTPLSEGIMKELLNE